MSRQAAHPAFPPIPGASGTRSLPPVPTTPSDFRNLINGCDTPQSIHECLVPLLQQISEGKGQSGTSKDKVARGEELLSMPDEDLSRLQDAAVTSLAAALVYIVSARLNRRRSQRLHNEELLAFASKLCTMGDENQLHLCRPRTDNLAWGILRLTQQMKKPELAVQPLYNLISRSTNQGMLSGAHAALLEACLLARSYDHALSVMHELPVDVYSAAPSYLDMITYHHHAGLICVAMRDYARAVDFFSAAVSVPTQAASAVQLACAKRAILCELVVCGKASPPLVQKLDLPVLQLLHFPKYTHSSVTRAIERNAQEYTKLAKAFEARDWTAVKAAEGKAEFTNDCNGGLFGQVLASALRRRILKVKDTYTRIRIDDLASKVGKASATGATEIMAVLQGMITSGAIHASLTTSTIPGGSIVTFSDEDTYPASSGVLAQVDRANDMASWLKSQLAYASKQMGINSAYLKKQASVLEVTGGKGSGKNGKMDDFDAMMAAEEYGDRIGRGGVGANYSDIGY